ncbi:aldo/keto reductase [Methylobacillus gramineus]|uniref:aldo/keto reductase n=1 Tax=Methylobacillus gramineus TaxID=755169 RepID=UPI001CFFA9D6|nr:aldo/keto reductase [Methylobacillus gramineus]MCB5185299.1 aldo/keto reductase [Methylobacillus gramineus]
MNHQDLANPYFSLGDLKLNRLGFGAMRITGPGTWGEPQDREECLRVLRRLPELGVNFIDTADSYGPNVSEELIREALYPYPGMVIATKAGQLRHGHNIWVLHGDPAYLRQSLLMSMRRLNVEQIDLWQLHRIDPKVPRDEQFQAVADFQREGLIKHIGLSEVKVEEIQAAQQYFTVATIQNQYNMANRQHEAELEYCTEHGIGFIPWYPLAKSTLSNQVQVLDTIAAKYQATPNQIALAWLLKRSPIILPIPGTSKVRHLEENVKALTIELSDEDFAALSLNKSINHQP